MAPEQRAGDSSEHNTFLRGLRRYVPLVASLTAYRREWLSGDFIAGISVWALLVPQGVAYSSIVGVPAQYGLYTALFAVIGYALFGTSRQVITGPSATVAAVSASVIALVATSGALTPEWITATATLAVVAGAIYIVLGFLRMGWISNFLSTAVLGGFIFGFGIGLTIDQTHKILGVPKVSGSYWNILIGTIQEIPQTNLYTLAIGSTAIALLLLMRRFVPRWPRAFIVVGLSIIISSLLHVSTYGVKVVGQVPTGLPALTLPSFSSSTIGPLVLGAVAIILVGYSESLASAREEASKHSYEINTSQEMIAQGAANAASGLFGGFVVDGSLSKTTVADLAGQKTQLASLFTGAFILLTVLFLAGLFTNLPDAVLGAVVIDAAVGLIKVTELRRFMATSRKDFAAYLAAMAGLLFIGVLAGVLIGVALSLLLLIATASQSPVRRMGFDEQNQIFVDAEDVPSARTLPGVLVAEIDGPLFFADANTFRDALLKMVARDSPQAVVIDLNPVTIIDVDGADILTKIHGELTARGVRVTLARVGARERDLLRRTGTLAAYGDENVFVSVRGAVAALEASGLKTSTRVPNG